MAFISVKFQDSNEFRLQKKTLEKCRETLREVLKEWIILKLKDGDRIPELLLFS